MAYTTINDPTAYFQTKLYTGNASTQSITFDGNTNMQPDWVWIKSRTNTEYHNLVDSVRGNTKYLYSNSAEAEATDAQNNRLTSFNSNGFSLGADENANMNNQNFVSWNWKTGTSFTNDASSTGIGSIDSAGSVNDTAGFSICTHTGTGSNATIKHGLSTAPKMIITKKRSASGGWQVGHESIGWENGMYLYTTDAATGDAGAWNSTAPTSSIFTVGNSSFTNQSSATYVSYIFAEKKGFSKIASYIGSGSDVFIHTGFKVGWLLVKVADGTNGWLVIDTKRSPANPQGKFVYANANSAEGTVTYGEFFSNGFGWKGTNSIAVNQSGKQYIYYAIAENPFVTSTGIPATAR